MLRDQIWELLYNKLPGNRIQTYHEVVDRILAIPLEGTLLSEGRPITLGEVVEIVGKAKVVDI